MTFHPKVFAAEIGQPQVTDLSFLPDEMVKDHYSVFQDITLGNFGVSVLALLDSSPEEREEKRKSGRVLPSETNMTALSDIMGGLENDQKEKLIKVCCEQAMRQDIRQAIQSTGAANPPDMINLRLMSAEANAKRAGVEPDLYDQTYYPKEILQLAVENAVVGQLTGSYDASNIGPRLRTAASYASLIGWSIKDAFDAFSIRGMQEDRFDNFGSESAFDIIRGVKSNISKQTSPYYNEALGSSLEEFLVKRPKIPGAGFGAEPPQ
jgi:hypothetical protein